MTARNDYIQVDENTNITLSVFEEDGRFTVFAVEWVKGSTPTRQTSHGRQKMLEVFATEEEAIKRYEETLEAWK